MEQAILAQKYQLVQHGPLAFAIGRGICGERRVFQRIFWRHLSDLWQLGKGRLRSGSQLSKVVVTLAGVICSMEMLLHVSRS